MHIPICCPLQAANGHPPKSHSPRDPSNGRFRAGPNKIQASWRRCLSLDYGNRYFQTNMFVWMPHAQTTNNKTVGRFPGQQLAVGQNQWYHFGVGAPPILVGCSLGVRDFDPWPTRFISSSSPGLSQPKPCLHSAEGQKLQPASRSFLGVNTLCGIHSWSHALVAEASWSDFFHWESKEPAPMLEKDRNQDTTGGLGARIEPPEEGWFCWQNSKSNRHYEGPT